MATRLRASGMARRLKGSNAPGVVSVAWGMVASRQRTCVWRTWVALTVWHSVTTATGPSTAQRLRSAPCSSLERTMQRPLIKIGVMGSASTSLAAEGKVIGLLHGTGGAADMAQTLLDTLPVRATGAIIIADPAPEQLVDRCIARLCEQRAEQAAGNAGRDAALPN